MYYYNVKIKANYVNVFFSSLHDYLLCEEMLAKASSHIGTTDIILTEVDIFDIRIIMSLYRDFNAICLPIIK